MLALAAALALPGAAAAQQWGYELASAIARGSAPIEITTATTTELVAAPTVTSPGGGTAGVYVTGFDIEADGTGNITLVYGTKVSTPCDTGQHALTGVYHLTAQTHAGPFGNGFGVIFPAVPAGNEICAVTSAAVGMHGVISYVVK